MSLSEEERIIILMMRGYGDRQRSFREVQTLFNDEYRVGTSGISLGTISKTIKRFSETGSVKDRPRCGRPRTTTNPDIAVEVIQSFVEEPHTSIRKASQAHDISRRSIQRILKTAQFHPFKIKLVQELLEDDFDRRLEFCETFMEMIDEDPHLLDRVVFSDEATFFLNGNVNRHNFRYWSDENPHWTSESKTQYPEKLNVWAGIMGNQVIGPFFIEGNLTAAKYLDLLRDHIVPSILNIAGDNFDTLWFQQDGAPAHFGIQVRHFLDATFPNRWIGRRGKIEWPPRSPDLTPLDFFLWGFLKDRVYRTKPANLDELRQNIIDETGLITPQMLGKVKRSFYERLASCQEVGGHQFEQLR